MVKKRIAVVSTDEIHVNEHFGRAREFFIYDLDGGMTFLEKRPAETLSIGDPNHAFDPKKFGRISELLQDCSQVYVTQIGDTPAKKLREMGIEPIIFKGTISDIGEG